MSRRSSVIGIRKQRNEEAVVESFLLLYIYTCTSIDNASYPQQCNKPQTGGSDKEIKIWFS